MKKYIIIALLMVLGMACPTYAFWSIGVGNTPVVAAPSGQNFSDNFDRTDADAIGATWTEAAGNLSIVSNRLNFVTDSWGAIAGIYSGTATNTVNQYHKITYISGGYPAIIMRYTNSSSPFYKFSLYGSGGEVTWERMANLADESASTVGATGDIGEFSSGDRICITLSGTGTSTVARMWYNCTANAPDSATSWDSDITPNISWTDDPASPVDTGNYMGIMGVQASANTIVFDDFYGGDIP